MDNAPATQKLLSSLSHLSISLSITTVGLFKPGIPVQTPGNYYLGKSDEERLKEYLMYQQCIYFTRRDVWLIARRTTIRMC